MITTRVHEPAIFPFPSSQRAPQWRGNKIVVDFSDSGSLQAAFLAKESGPSLRLESAEMTVHCKDSFQTAHTWRLTST